jgi:hypothetical protein
MAVSNYCTTVPNTWLCTLCHQVLLPVVVRRTRRRTLYVCHSFKILCLYTLYCERREDGLIGPLVTQKGSTIFWNHVKASTKDERTVHSGLMFFWYVQEVVPYQYNKRYHNITIYFLFLHSIPHCTLSPSINWTTGNSTW